MKRPAFAILALAILAPQFAFAVPENDYGIVKDLLENRDGVYTTASFEGADKLKIAYTKYGSEAGEKGCLVIAPGQGEASRKYIETAYDLAARGFSPIYVIDHRGQGASDRVLPKEPQKNSVRLFDQYAQDLGTLVDSIVLKDAACRGHRLSLLTHSMGGAIGANYLENVGANSPFHRVVMSAPMAKIVYPEGKTEGGVLTETFFACLAPIIKGMHCDDFAPGKGPYDPKQDVFAGNIYTHSPVRFDMKKNIFTEWPNLIVGGPTIRWVRQAALADVALRERTNAQRIASPLLILQATEDKIVDNAGENELCANAHDCRISRIQGASHEILMESDAIRDKALDQIVNFLGN